MIQLTDENGDTIWVNPMHIVTITRLVMQKPTTKVVMAHSSPLYVEETCKEICKLCDR